MGTQIYKSGRIFVALKHRIIFSGLLQILQFHFRSRGGGHNYLAGHGLIFSTNTFIFSLKPGEQTKFKIKAIVLKTLSWFLKSQIWFSSEKEFKTYAKEHRQSHLNLIYESKSKLSSLKWYLFLLMPVNPGLLICLIKKECRVNKASSLISVLGLTNCFHQQ